MADVHGLNDEMQGPKTSAEQFGGRLASVTSCGKGRGTLGTKTISMDGSPHRAWVQT